MRTAKKSKLKLEAKIKGLGKVYGIIDCFSEALQALRTLGIENPITLRDLAYARIQVKRKNSLCKYGSFVREGIIYAPKEPVLFVSHSPFLTKELAIGATTTHRNRKEFYLNSEKYQKYKDIAEEDRNKEPEKRRVLILDKRKNKIPSDHFKIPVNHFKDEKLALWAFKDQTENYDESLRDNGINGKIVWLIDENYVNKQKNPFVRQLYFCWTTGKHGFRGRHRGSDRGIESNVQLLSEEHIFGGDNGSYRITYYYRTRGVLK